MRALLICLLPLAATACDIDAKMPAEGGKEKVAITANADGNVKFDLPIAKGEIKLPAAMMANSDFDIDGVKMVPGGKITGFNVNAGEDQGAKVDLSFTAPTAPAAVRGYFLEQFKAKGIDAEATGEGVSGTTKDGDRFSMSFAPQGSGTQGSIRIDAAR